MLVFWLGLFLLSWRYDESTGRVLVLGEPVPGEVRGGLPQLSEMYKGSIVSNTGVTAKPGVIYSAGWDGCSSWVSRVGYWVIRLVMNTSAEVMGWG
jgi:hypothetical protein